MDSEKREALEITGEQAPQDYTLEAMTMADP
jgi:hypothetical protein